ncbi:MULTISPECIES: ATP-binding protein [unclassified Streptomyces]|uniref:ATP-binding protein n=1 Tax=unclassified Streptomyces TaxID=2593676 RepID=UPI001C8DC1CB|nr:ATP-binding protein [Streptomyces sp. WAC 01420]
MSGPGARTAGPSGCQVRCSSGRRGGELLFQVLTGREERNGVALASDECFSGWGRIFTGRRLCAAIVRLAVDGAIVRAGTESCRLARAKALTVQAAVG